MFFSNNDKLKNVKDKELKKCKYVVANNKLMFSNQGNAAIFPNAKVNEEANVALAKEEAASRLALEILQKDMESTSNLFVIDESCTEATVETNLTTNILYNTNSNLQSQDIVQKEEINDVETITTDLKMSSSLNDLQPQLENNSEPINQSFDIPVLYKNSNFVNLSGQLLPDFTSENTIYQEDTENSDINFHEYFINDYSMEETNSVYQMEKVCFELKNSEIVNYTEPSLTSNHTDTANPANPAFDQTNTTSEVQNDQEITEIINIKNNPKYITTENTLEENFDYSMFYESLKSENTTNITPKPKRGRPKKNM